MDVDEEATALRHEARVAKQKLSAVMEDMRSPLAAPAVEERSALRAAYVQLLLTRPHTRAAQLADASLWTDTTYTVIANLRTQLAQLEREARVAAYKRVRKDLRVFLHDEQVFWEGLAVELVQRFSLREARGVLKALGIDEDVRKKAFRGWSLPAAAPAPVLAYDGTGARRLLLETLQRVLTYAGDLVRYSQMHAALPLAFQRQPETRSPDFTRAVLFYHEAHLLLPDHGNPSNQLAVVATYVGDTFGSMYQYYRALCVRVPFETSRANLSRLFDKAIEAWMVSPRRQDVLTAWREAALTESAAHRAPMPSISMRWASLNEWFASLVVLHGLYALQAEYVHSYKYKLTQPRHGVRVERCTAPPLSDTVRDAHAARGRLPPHRRHGPLCVVVVAPRAPGHRAPRAAAGRADRRV